MKIGILTYHCVPNFGAQLQTISTVGFLKQCGHDPIVLHWFPKDLENIYAKGRVPKEQIGVHDKLTESALPLSRLCRTEQELIDVVNSLNLDALIAGSDALFKYQPEKGRRAFSKRKFRYVIYDCVLVEMLDGNPFFGAFLGKLKKRIPAVVFSVSSQNCPYRKMTYAERKRMRSALSHYSFISVRDEWTQSMVRWVTGVREVPITPDPVFSFNQNIYFELPDIDSLKKKYNLSDNYILVSFSKNNIHPDYIRDLEFEISKRGLQPVAFPMPEGCYDFGMKKIIPLPLSPLEWYVLIKNAKGYIGERMHPIVVALHNSVPFFSFDEYGTCETSIWNRYPRYKKESSKTYLILRRAGLTDYIYSYQDKETIPSVVEIVDKIISFDANKCSSFSREYRDYYKKSMESLLCHL